MYVVKSMCSLEIIKSKKMSIMFIFIFDLNSFFSHSLLIGTFRKKLMQILDSITFHHNTPLAPHWDYFENEEIERLLKECEVQEFEGPRLIDVELLHSRLSEETVGLKNAPILGQRQIMMQVCGIKF